MKVVFMGTPDFAVPVLEAIVKQGHEVCGVFVQPDKPKGRGKSMQFPPVKEKAVELGLTVYQPARIKESEWVNQLKELSPDIMIVVAFGQILSQEILDIPPKGCVNVHASLLPKYRGAAPIQQAVIDGEAVSGVTTMYMEKGLDTGDIIEWIEVPIEEKETGGSYHDKLSVAGAKLCISTMTLIEENRAPRIPQDDEKSSYAHMLNKAMGKLDFHQDAVVLERLIRGLNPWPSAYCLLQGKMLKIYEADLVEGVEGFAPGTICAVDKNSFSIQCGNGALRVKNLQLEGKKRMSTDAFLLGYTVEVGMTCSEQ